MQNLEITIHLYKTVNKSTLARDLKLKATEVVTDGTGVKG